MANTAKKGEFWEEKTTAKTKVDFSDIDKRPSQPVSVQAAATVVPLRAESVAPSSKIPAAASVAPESRVEAVRVPDPIQAGLEKWERERGITGNVATVRVPMKHETTYAPTYIEGSITGRQAAAIRAARFGLEKNDARLENGQKVNSSMDVVRWVAERLADEFPAPAHFGIPKKR